MTATVTDGPSGKVRHHLWGSTTSLHSLFLCLRAFSLWKQRMLNRLYTRWCQLILGADFVCYLISQVWCRSVSRDPVPSSYSWFCHRTWILAHITWMERVSNSHRQIQATLNSTRFNFHVDHYRTALEAVAVADSHDNALLKFIQDMISEVKTVFPWMCPSRLTGILSSRSNVFTSYNRVWNWGSRCPQVYATARALFVRPRTQKLLQDGIKIAYSYLTGWF